MVISWIRLWVDPRKRWGEILLSLILLTIILVNIHPGALVLGNDNFSPNLNPALSLERSIFNPAWRTYRVLGIPSDSEQSDIFRTFIFFVLHPIVPAWILSQGYLFFTFFIASFSAGQLVAFVLKRRGEKVNQAAIFIGGVLYISNLLTSWVYFFPVYLFVAAYAFLPFVLWRMLVFVEKTSAKNALLLLVASLLLSTAALTATMFLICSIVIGIFILVALFKQDFQKSYKNVFLPIIFSLILIFGTQLYWALPFLTYVKSNTQALKASSVNRDITASTIENEAKNNTAINSLRYYSSWLDTKENNNQYTFKYRDWYVKSFGSFLSLVPVMLFGAGIFFVLKKRLYYLLPLIVLWGTGWLLIKGGNPPLGGFFEYIQNSFPTVAQIFRWQSSKLWPMLIFPVLILGTAGFLGLFSGNKYMPVVRKGLSVVIVLMLLIFIYPYFTGNLVRNKVFVRPPAAYQQLAQYLAKNDPNSRIYLAPEANTLYFRNYTWGFWGSVFLNYVVPNPIIEKALIIGSNENEQAFTVIRNAYYADDPVKFTNALALYNTPFVLSDKYASQGDTGYAYNWNIQNHVVENSPYLERVWRDGKLALYKVKKQYQNPAFTVTRVFPQTDFLLANSIRVGANNINHYYTDREESGLLFPFALKQNALTITQEEIITSTNISVNNASYAFPIIGSQIPQLPTEVVYSNNSGTITLRPSYPYILVNGKEYKHQFPGVSDSVREPAQFISLGDDVVDVRMQPLSIFSFATPFQNVVSHDIPVQTWGGTFQPFNLLPPDTSEPEFFCNNSSNVANIPVQIGKKTKCGSNAIQVKKDSVFEITLKFHSNNPTQALFCIESSYHKTCQNRNNSLFSNPTIGEANFFIPRVFRAGDMAKVYIDFLPTTKKSAKATIDALYINMYSDSEKHTFESQSNVVYPDQKITVPIRKGSVFELHIPKISGVNGFTLQSDGDSLAEVSGGSFDQNQTSLANTTVLGPSTGLQVTNTESNVFIFSKTPLFDARGGMGMVALTGGNSSGIPLQFSIKSPNVDYNMWNKELYYKTVTNTLDLFSLPENVVNYQFQLTSLALGPHPSINTVGGFVFQVIPQSWYTIRLTPEVDVVEHVTKLSQANKIDTGVFKGVVADNTIATIPNATSPYWTLTGSKNAQPVAIDGWQQGFLVKNGGKVTVNYWSNKLAYIGYAVLTLIVLGVLFILVKDKLVARRLDKFKDAS